MDVARECLCRIAELNPSFEAHSSHRSTDRDRGSRGRRRVTAARQARHPAWWRRSLERSAGRSGGELRCARQLVERGARPASLVACAGRSAGSIVFCLLTDESVVRCTVAARSASAVICRAGMCLLTQWSMA